MLFHQFFESRHYILSNHLVLGKVYQFHRMERLYTTFQYKNPQMSFHFLELQPPTKGLLLQPS